MGSWEDVLRQDKKISLEAAPPLIRISLWPTELENTVNSEQSWKHSIKQNTAPCLFELEGRKADKITGSSICSEHANWLQKKLQKKKKKSEDTADSLEISDDTCWASFDDGAVQRWRYLCECVSRARSDCVPYWYNSENRNYKFRFTQMWQNLWTARLSAPVPVRHESIEN